MPHVAARHLEFGSRASVPSVDTREDVLPGESLSDPESRKDGRLAPDLSRITRSGAAPACTAGRAARTRGSRAVPLDDTAPQKQPAKNRWADNALLSNPNSRSVIRSAASLRSAKHYGDRGGDERVRRRRPMFRTRDARIDLVIPETYRARRRADPGFSSRIARGPNRRAAYALRDLLEVPIYGTKLTIGLIRTKLKEHKLAERATFREIAPGTPFTIGSFRCDSYYVCHSIPDAIGVTIDTPYGALVHSGDWKFDHTPVDGRQTDFARLAAIAAKGVLLLMSDSTRAEVPGYTQSERHVAELFDAIMSRAPGRVIKTTSHRHLPHSEIVETPRVGPQDPTSGLDGELHKTAGARSISVSEARSSPRTRSGSCRPRACIITTGRRATNERA